MAANLCCIMNSSSGGGISRARIALFLSFSLGFASLLSRRALVAVAAVGQPWMLVFNFSKLAATRRRNCCPSGPPIQTAIVRSGELLLRVLLRRRSIFAQLGLNFSANFCQPLRFSSLLLSSTRLAWRPPIFASARRRFVSRGHRNRERQVNNFIGSA